MQTVPLIWLLDSFSRLQQISWSFWAESHHGQYAKFRHPAEDHNPQPHHPKSRGQKGLTISNNTRILPVPWLSCTLAKSNSCHFLSSATFSRCCSSELTPCPAFRAAKKCEDMAMAVAMPRVQWTTSIHGAAGSLASAGWSPQWRPQWAPSLMRYQPKLNRGTEDPAKPRQLDTAAGGHCSWFTWNVLKRKSRALFDLKAWGVSIYRISMPLTPLGLGRLQLSTFHLVAPLDLHVHPKSQLTSWKEKVEGKTPAFGPQPASKLKQKNLQS